VTSFLPVLNGVATFFAIGSSTNTLLARKQAQDNSETGPSATTAWKISGDVMRTLRRWKIALLFLDKKKTERTLGIGNRFSTRAKPFGARDGIASVHIDTVLTLKTLNRICVFDGVLTFFAIPF
jgi:hypothetical protein